MFYHDKASICSRDESRISVPRISGNLAVLTDFGRDGICQYICTHIYGNSRFSILTVILHIKCLVHLKTYVTNPKLLEIFIFFNWLSHDAYLVCMAEVWSVTVIYIWRISVSQSNTTAVISSFKRESCWSFCLHNMYLHLGTKFLVR